MNCPHCSAFAPEDAKFCPQCGFQYGLLETMKGRPDFSSGRNWKLSLLTVFLSLGLTFLLIGVFHLPIFILGITVPLYWIRWPGRK